MAPTVTALIIARNEAANIARCLRSVAWATERVMIDAESTDATVEIARGLGATVVIHPWPGYSEQRNFGQGVAAGEWIFCIDADERATPQLRDEVLNFVATAPTEVAAATIPIRDWMFGAFVEHGSWPHQRHVRLYRRARATWRGAVHEGLTIDGQTGALTSPLLHFSHLTLERFIAKLNAYTEIEARGLKASGKTPSLARATFGALRAFLGQYVRLSGYRDGGRGFILAVLMAGYFFVTQAKLWAAWHASDPPDPDGQENVP